MLFSFLTSFNINKKTLWFRRGVFWYYTRDWGGRGSCLADCQAIHTRGRDGTGWDRTAGGAGLWGATRWLVPLLCCMVGAGGSQKK